VVGVGVGATGAGLAEGAITDAILPDGTSATVWVVMFLVEPTTVDEAGTFT
jgi:hypothetical protein